MFSFSSHSYLSTTRIGNWFYHCSSVFRSLWSPVSVSSRCALRSVHCSVLVDCWKWNAGYTTCWRVHNSEGYRKGTRNLEYFQSTQDLYSDVNLYHMCFSWWISPAFDRQSSPCPSSILTSTPTSSRRKSFRWKSWMWPRSMTSSPAVFPLLPNTS